MLLDAHPCAATEKTVRGWTPLHVALARKPPEGIVRMLSNAYPDGLREKSEQG